MASLEELRAQLGSVDDKIVELYEERMKSVKRSESVRLKMAIRRLTVSVKKIL